MRIYKKMTMFAGAALLAAAMTFTAFAQTQTNYEFTYKEHQVSIGEEASAAIKKLGDAKKVSVLTNCADDAGTDKAYIYENFDVYTTKKDKKEVVSEITLKTAQAETEEGLKIGASVSEMKKIYPEAKGSAGLYTVTLGTTSLLIDCGLKDDKVVSITYQTAQK